MCSYFPPAVVEATVAAAEAPEARIHLTRVEVEVAAGRVQSPVLS
jgi:hypothetical protein